MYGEVIVPYDGIGGSNMNDGIMPLNLAGSSEPGVVEDQDGTTLNIKWRFPGGIKDGVQPEAPWGHMVAYRDEYPTQNTDATVINWLKGNPESIPGIRREVPNPPLTDEEIAAEIPRISDEINRLLRGYANDLLTKPNTNHDVFKVNYASCIVIGR